MTSQGAQVISIFECQSILKLQDLSPEELVDKIFGSFPGFKMNRDEFKDSFKVIDLIAIIVYCFRMNIEKLSSH